MKTSQLFSLKNLSGTQCKDLDHLVWELWKSILMTPIKCESWSFTFCNRCNDKFQSEVGSCPKMWITPKVGKVQKKISEELSSLEFKCVNRYNGCKVVVKHKNVISHNEECEFRKVTWTGQPLCEERFLKRDISQHENFWKFVKVSCNLCDTAGLLRGQLQKHFIKDCKNSELWKNWGIHSKKSKSPHVCVKALKEKVDTLYQLQETKEMEFKENLRNRDIKISMLVTKQREFWKYLTKLQRSLESLPKSTQIF